MPGRLRELAILRIALLNRAHYEYEGHVPYALRNGVRQAQIDALENWQQSSEFDAVERVVLAYTDSMTRQIQVPDDVFAAVKKQFNEREVVELTATIGAYNCVSRFLESDKDRFRCLKPALRMRRRPSTALRKHFAVSSPAPIQDGHSKVVWDGEFGEDAHAVHGLRPPLHRSVDME